MIYTSIPRPSIAYGVCNWPLSAIGVALDGGG
jgi:hypothetical protein